jgi:hypothetical protein
VRSGDGFSDMSGAQKKNAGLRRAPILPRLREGLA